MEHPLRHGRRPEGRQEEDWREERHRPDRPENLDLLTYFNTLYLFFYFNDLNLIIVNALNLLIYFNALNLIVVKAVDLLIYFDALNLLIYALSLLIFSFLYSWRP